MKIENNWKVWDKNINYGETLYKRAIGELPEMESSKKMAKELAKKIQNYDKVLDVGCGSGHYLRSFRREIGNDFYYTGIDATEEYIEFARKAFKSDPNSNFEVSDIYSIDIMDESYDIVTCNNVLLHLPSIEIPINELIRVGKKFILIRFLCGEHSFRIKDVNLETEEYDENGEPLNYYYFNIYSKKYIQKIIEKNERVKSWSIEEDIDFDKERIRNSISDHKGAINATKIIGKYQVNVYILLPWSILTIELK